MVMYENAAGLLSLGDEGDYLRIDWKQGQRDDAAIQAVFEQALQAAKELQWHKLLVNQQVMLSSSSWAEAWFIHDWLPRLGGLGITAGICAVVVGQNVVTRTNTAGYLGQVGTEKATYRVQQFIFEQDAIEWLLQAP